MSYSAHQAVRQFLISLPSMAVAAIKVTYGSVMSALAFVKSILVDVIIIVSIILIGIVTYKEIRSRDVVLEEISLPKKLTDLGYSGQVASMRLNDAVNNINEEARRLTDLSQQTRIVPTSRQIELVEPQSGLSLRVVSQLVASILPWERTHVAGEFVCVDENCELEKMSLRLRIMNGSSLEIASAGPIGIVKSDRDLDTYFRKSAVELLKRIDPIVIAEHMAASASLPTYKQEFGASIAVTREAIRIGKKLVRNGHAESARAAALIGQMYSQLDDRRQAETWFKRVAVYSRPEEVAMDGTAQYLWGNMLYDADDATAARERWSAAASIFAAADGNGMLGSNAYIWWGQALEALGRDPEAAEVYDRWEKAEPDEPGAFFHHGLLQARTGGNEKVDEAIDNLTTATDLDPAHAYAYNELGNLYLRQGDSSAAFGALTRAVKFAPNDSTVKDNLVRVARLISATVDTCAVLQENMGILESAMSDEQIKELLIFSTGCSDNEN